MVASAKNLKTEVDDRLTAGGLTDLECCQLQNAQTILSNNIVHSVANLASLPSAALNEGRFVYVDDINEYRFSTGETWSDDISSTIAPYSRQIWIWGNNNCGQLGDGTNLTRCSPVREICSATDWCQVSSGQYHTAAIKTTGQLWSWGTARCGRLGDGTTGSVIHVCSPVREFCSATDWCGVSAGAIHTTAIKTTGQIWSWGCNFYGILGDGTTETRISPIREFCSATDWCQVSNGNRHTTAIKTSGELWVWGNGGNCGQLGDGTTVNKCSPVREFCSATDWCQVSGGQYHTVAVKTTGQIWTWGNNGCGRLGDGTTVSKCSPVREFCSATDWCRASASAAPNNHQSVAIKTSGQIWAWGSNNYGQLGDGTIAPKCSPVREFCSATDWCGVSAGGCHMAAIKTSGQIWTWGAGSCGRLGDGTLTNRCSPVREFCSVTDWCQVSAGACSTSAIKAFIKGFLE